MFVSCCFGTCRAARTVIEFAMDSATRKKTGQACAIKGKYYGKACSLSSVTSMFRAANPAIPH